MKDFPKNKIKPLRARLSGEPGNASIEIFLEAFVLELDDYKEEVETSIRLDQIELPTLAAEKLGGKHFKFPTNPEPGYIDGSVYFFAAHHPVDVTEIKFGKVKNNQVSLTAKTKWVLEFENSGFKNFQTEIHVELEL